MNEQGKMLIIADGKLIDDNLLSSIENKNLQLAFCQDYNSAINEVEKKCFDIVFIDIRILIHNERGLFKKIKESDENSQLIIMVMPEFVSTAYELIKSGYYGFINIPVNKNEVLHTVESALAYRQLKLENIKLKKKLGEFDELFDGINETEDVSLASFEKKYILQVLNNNKWNISRSANLLKIDRVTLYNKINKYNLRTAVEA